MTVEEAIACIQRGACPVPKRNEGCATCDRTDEAIRVLVAEGARRAQDECVERANAAESLSAAMEMMGEPGAERIAREVLP